MGWTDRERDVFRETSYTPPPLVLLSVGVFLLAAFCALLGQSRWLYTIWGTGVYTMGEQLALALIVEVSLLLSGTFAVGVFWLLVDERSAHRSRFAVIPMRLILFQIGLLLLTVAGVDYANNVRLLLWGVETEGIVNGTDAPHSGIRKRPTGAVFSISLLSKSNDYVLFRAADGRLYRSQPIYHFLGSGAPGSGEAARVLYLPGDPSISKYPGAGMWAFGIITIPLGAAAWYVLCTRVWKKRSRSRRLSMNR